MTIQERNQKILACRRNGMTMVSIAKEFHRSRALIQNILKASKKQERIKKQSARLQQQIIKSNDIDKKWDKTDLINMLNLPAVTTGALLVRNSYFNGDKISLRQLMDLIINEKGNPSHGCSVTPVLRLRTFGKKGFNAILKSMATLDLGEMAKREWDNRVKFLMKCNEALLEKSES